MRYCKKCLQPDTRPGILFNEDGVCYACLYEESKKQIDWDQRFSELQKIADEAKEKARKTGNPYDCVIGVSGGKDSTFQAVYCKEKLGLNPLLVNIAPDEITEIGRQNLDNLSKLGFDMISIRVNPKVAKILARKSFFEKGNIVTVSEYCLWASAYIIADKFDIPLIIQGEEDLHELGRCHRHTCLDSDLVVTNQMIKYLKFATLDKGKHDKQQKNGLSTLPKTPPGCKKGGVFA